jgi:hypothetical protein
MSGYLLFAFGVVLHPCLYVLEQTAALLRGMRLVLVYLRPLQVLPLDELIEQLFLCVAVGVEGVDTEDLPLLHEAELGLDSRQLEVLVHRVLTLVGVVETED